MQLSRYVIKFLAITLLLCFFKTGYCQTQTDSLSLANLKRLESGILEKAMLVQTQRELELIRKQAVKSNNNILLARSLFDLMQVRDQRTEDTLYFRNSAFIDTLLAGSVSSELRALLFLILAQRISRFDSRPLRFNYAAYRTKALKIDYAAFDRRQRDSVVAKDLDSALSYHGFKGKGKQLLWLSSNPDIFLFDPQFEDIVLSERINLLAIKGYYSGTPWTPFGDWLSLPSPAFRKSLDTLAAGRSNKNERLTAYGRWLSFHKTEPETAAFIESLARKSIYLSVSSDTLVRRTYIDYLQELIKTPYPAAKAHAVYQLCLMWNEDGNKYSNLSDRYSYRYAYQPRPTFDPKYRNFPAMALALYEQHTGLIQQYPVFNAVLVTMAQQIKTVGLRVEMTGPYLPYEDIPLKVMYKNADTLYYRVITTKADEHAGLQTVIASDELLGRKTEQAGSFKLPLPPDHNKHAVYLKLGALPLGHYRLLFSNKPIRPGGPMLNNMGFEVTKITAVNTDEQLFVLDRKTGFPLAGAQIQGFKKGVEADKGLVTSLVPQNGCIKISGEAADSIHITYKGDTSGYRFSIRQNEVSDDIFDKDSYDDLDEFFDEKVRMNIFTDRAIYRPGQTVHYKIIFLTKDPDNGSTILFNSKNVDGFFKKRLKKWLSDANDKILLKDPFNKQIDSAVLKINDFGSFAGTFVLPKTAATGSWSIDGKAKTDRNNGEFEVEEYKRPTIELSMEKQKTMLLPGAPFAIKLKLRSLSGADLGHIPIEYTIDRSGSMPSKKGGLNDLYNNYVNTELINKTGFTDEKGELLISVKDTLLAKTALSDSIVWNYNYTLNAKAVDATGESTELKENVDISSRPVKINIPVAKTYDRQALPILNISTTADFEGTIGRKVNIKLYKTNNPDQPKTENKAVDQWYYTETDWNKWFPDLASAVPGIDQRVLVLDTVVNTANYEKLTLTKDRLTAGFYQLVSNYKENDRTVGQSLYSFKVFDSITGESPVDDIDYMPANSAKPGDLLTWYSTAENDNYTIYQVLYTSNNKKRKVENIYYPIAERAGFRTWHYRIPPNAIGEILLNRIYVGDNDVRKFQHRVYLYGPASTPPGIIIERYRKVMVPGAQETFSLSVKTKNENTAAELMTTLYDASLDKLEKQVWELPNTEQRRVNLYTDWNYSLVASRIAGEFKDAPQDIESSLQFGYTGTPGAAYALQGRLAGVSITNASGLNEVVVTDGYGTERRMNLTGSVSYVTVRGISSLQDYSQPLIILDGQIFTGDLKTFNAASITQAMVLKGADASAIYGSRAAQGVLVISTKGPIVFPEPEEPVVKVRKNFNETAFFFPQVHAGTDGFYTFSFTMPETATEWKWKMLAHTRDAQFTYLERTLQTQLNLMVQPNMPRLLYQGDKIRLQSRISNLDTLAVTGRASCKIEDAVTGQDLTAVLTAASTQAFSLDKKSSGAVSFFLQVPAGQLNPLKIIITATGEKTADAEEHILPVLSSKVFIRQSQSVQFNNNASINLAPVKLPADAELYGMGISINQKPQAALIYALPWLANYSYDCAEQTFNKLRAQATALRLMQRDTNAQQAFKKAKGFIEKQKPASDELPDELAEQAMPWLHIGNHAALQQKQLFYLLDTSVTKSHINVHLERLFKLQQPDGGLAWFDGGKSSDYISAYVLAGFGQLWQQGWRPVSQVANRQQEFINQLCVYNQAMISIASMRTYDFFQLYALSYWRKGHDLPGPLVQKINLLLDSGWRNVNSRSIGQQALLIINTLRFTQPENALYKKALDQLENISQLAINDEVNGIRWKDIADAEEMGSSREETVAILSEAFKLSGKYANIPSGIVKWLLTTKQDEHWETTKGTAAAIDLLQQEKGSVFGESKAFSASVAGRNLAVSDGLLNGIPASFTAIKQQPASLTLQQQGTGAGGALTWYYFATPDRLDTLNKAVKISKTFYSYDKDKGWVILTAKTALKAGDPVKVRLVIETASRLKFVHISDPRAAAFEPKENNSGYRYGNGFSYYQSVKDYGSDLFTESLPKGITELSYEMVVAHDGEFTSGPARIRCMYSPEITAYSSTEKIRTGEK